MIKIKEPIDCIDSGTEFCPCHLAESNECILCSQLQGDKFCDCSNWNGVCIYQEFIYNNKKANPSRDVYNCNVVNTKLLEENLLQIDFEVPHKLCIDLVKPGSFVFVRGDENIYFDAPISILKSNIDTNVVTIMIEICGIKTKKLLNIKKDFKITIRGPYWNGVFGLKNIQNSKNTKTLVLARGIGVAPVIPVLKKLTENNNNITLLIDKEPYENIYVDEYLNELNLSPTEINILDKGELSTELKLFITSFLKSNDVKLIHLAGADILTYKIIQFLNEINRNDIKLSACNNSKMCCGEGVCGSCTTRFSGRRVKRFCKLQAEPRSIFEGRRFI